MEDIARAVKKVPAGHEIVNPKPGDFFLVHKTSFIPRLIQFGQGLRFSKEEAYWNHCGTFTDEDGSIVEALVRNGVTQGDISKYKDIEYIVVHIDSDEADQERMKKVAQWLVGREYGMLTDISLAFWCLFGGHFDFSLDDQMICSALSARVLEANGYMFDRGSQREMPADLARHFNVHRQI